VLDEDNFPALGAGGPSPTKGAGAPSWAGSAQVGCHLSPICQAFCESHQ